VSTWTFSSESVTEGHPDKMADQISDAVLDAILAEDPMGRVACETLVTTGLVVVAGGRVVLRCQHRSAITLSCQVGVVCDVLVTSQHTVAVGTAVWSKAWIYHCVSSHRTIFGNSLARARLTRHKISDRAS